MRILFAKCALLTAVFSLTLAGQGVGVIDGTVLDSSDAIVPGAPIVLKNTATSVTANATSSQEGIFHISRPDARTVFRDGFGSRFQGMAAEQHHASGGAACHAAAETGGGNQQRTD